MPSRAQVLADPRSGAKAGAGRRPPRDQGTRDELAAARARTRQRPRPPPATSPTAPLPAAAADEPSSAPAPASPSAGPAPSSGGRASFGSEGAGAFLALLVYPLVVNFLLGGQARAVGWIKAKWINQPYNTSAPSSSASQARQHQGAGAVLSGAKK